MTMGFITEDPIRAGYWREMGRLQQQQAYRDQRAVDEALRRGLGSVSAGPEPQPPPAAVPDFQASSGFTRSPMGSEPPDAAGLPDATNVAPRTRTRMPTAGPGPTPVPRAGSQTDQLGRVTTGEFPFTPTGNAAVDAITPTVLSAEGWNPNPYDDNGVTISQGFGGRPVGHTMTMEEGVRQAQDRLLDFDRQLDSRLSPESAASLTPQQRGVLLSLGYNMRNGLDSVSQLIDRLNRGDKAGFLQALRQYDHSGGSTLRGLTARRYREGAVFAGQPDPGQDAALRAVAAGQWPMLGQRVGGQPNEGNITQPVTPGNIDLNNRPVVRNQDGSYSTVRSMSFQDQDGLETLIPTVSPDGRILDQEQAISLYRATGQHLGKFKTVQDANQFAQSLHDQQARQYDSRAQQPGQRPAGLAGVTSGPAMQQGYSQTTPGIQPWNLQPVIQSLVKTPGGGAAALRLLIADQDRATEAAQRRHEFGRQAFASLASGQPEAAQYYAGLAGLKIDPALLQRSTASALFGKAGLIAERLGAHDPAWATKFTTAYVQSGGDPMAAMQAAGTPHGAQHLTPLTVRQADNDVTALLNPSTGEITIPRDANGQPYGAATRRSPSGMALTPNQVDRAWHQESITKVTTTGGMTRPRTPEEVAAAMDLRFGGPEWRDYRYQVGGRHHQPTGGDQANPPPAIAAPPIQPPAQAPSPQPEAPPVEDLGGGALVDPYTGGTLIEPPAPPAPPAATPPAAPGSQPTSGAKTAREAATAYGVPEQAVLDLLADPSPARIASWNRHLGSKVRAEQVIRDVRK